MRIVLALLVAQLFGAAAAAAEEGKQLIWANIPLVKAGNYHEFEAELSRTRVAARSEALGELAALLIPLAWSTDDVGRLAHVLAGTILQFDELARRQAEQAHDGIPLSLADDFRSAMEHFYTERRLTDGEQRAGFTYVSPDDLQAMASKPMTAAEAQQLVHDLRFVAYGSYTVLEHARVRVVLNLDDVVNLRTRSFAAEGPISQVGGLLAVKVMDFLQGAKYRSWDNPQPQLTWIAPPFPQTRVRAEIAARYCEGQKARLPYATELLQAALGSNYREGGIGPLMEDAAYIVADRNLHDMQYYYSTGQMAQIQTGGPVHTSAGHGTVVGYYWCVRGEPSKQTLFDQAVYRLIRQNRQQQRSRVVFALEYVLVSRSDLGLDQAGVAPRAASFPSIESAVQFLAENGIYLQLPVN